MVLTAVILFCLTVALGLYLVMLGVCQRRGSRALGALHAVVAALGLVFLGIRVFAGPVNFLYNSAALLFMLAFSGGLVLLALRFSAREPQSPPSMIGVGLHAAMALMALFLLMLGYLGA